MTEINVEETYELKETSLLKDVTLSGPIKNKRSLFNSNSSYSCYTKHKNKVCTQDECEMMQSTADKPIMTILEEG